MIEVERRKIERERKKIADLRKRISDVRLRKSRRADSYRSRLKGASSTLAKKRIREQRTREWDSFGKQVERERRSIESAQKRIGFARDRISRAREAIRRIRARKK